ncbi:hypothetical protein UFOVP158_29 [uncultured Caudovirales phage]|uniref:Uncharacterized protein n=1 Tax=uncultured Caudovirales phage TaxID=2100421 RepID=A0A6J7WEK8_9CAUD|nr:hypothetical protein UFOVP158_29 [uncultured Caudovirales phage]
MRVLGIDPGKTGALALWVPDSRYLEVRDMPSSPVRVAGDVRWFTEVGVTAACIEKVGGVGRQSASRSFTFGFGTGVIYGALAAFDIVPAEVTPMKWKAAFGLKRDTGETDASFKGRSRSLASELFPEYSLLFCRAKDDGRAEAALIAYYSAAQLRQGESA